jgi:hypothetical protein
MEQSDPVYQQPILQPTSAASIFNQAFSPPRNAGRVQTQEEIQEEFEKRLRGEYQAAQQRLGTVVSSILCSWLDVMELKLHGSGLGKPKPTTQTYSYNPIPFTSYNTLIIPEPPLIPFHLSSTETSAFVPPPFTPTAPSADTTGDTSNIEIHRLAHR